MAVSDNRVGDAFGDSSDWTADWDSGSGSPMPEGLRLRHACCPQICRDTSWSRPTYLYESNSLDAKLDRLSLGSTCGDGFVPLSTSALCLTEPLLPDAAGILG